MIVERKGSKHHHEDAKARRKAGEGLKWGAGGLVTQLSVVGGACGSWRGISAEDHWTVSRVLSLSTVVR